MTKKDELEKRLKQLAKDTAELSKETEKLQKQNELDAMIIQAIQDRMPPIIYDEIEPVLHDEVLMTKMGSLNLVKIVADLYFNNQFKKYLD